MHVRKYDVDYGRRKLLEKLAYGVASAGVLTPLWPMVARADNGDISKAYPDELLSIEVYTKGKVKPGDVITADNVEHVKELLDPIAYQQVKTMGRRINIVESTTDISKLFPYDYLQATLRNEGKARVNEQGNVVTTDGGPWIGGNPFPEPQTGLEAIANLTLSWGRHDYSQYAVRDWDIGPNGQVAYQYDFVWAEANTTARVDGTVWRGREDLLRYQTVWFTSPYDVAGTSFLNIWNYDQRKFPELLGYLPQYRRVRQFPTNQRFEPLVPGITLFLSDAWAAGDPMLVWGNYRIVDRKPMLGAVSGRNFMGGYHDNWEKPAHGGPEDQTFFDTWMELVPECIVLEAEPTGYSRAPVGKKRIWIDVRNQMYVAYNTLDRRGDLWKSFEPSYAQFSNDKETYYNGDHPAWSWTHVMSYDYQANRMSRFLPAKEVTGGYKTTYSMGDRDVYNEFFTAQALRRLSRR